ncbi:MAG TPA: response regulator transcription factor [Flavihumibacter sp.]|nr:response regulator transcription factor [Bacteroidota bacterium]HOA38448.1 response regulator transcription factor [Flavihumibacter sp.]HPZ88974.1 response regulator transcription factor [Flavihumibacter sp.]
MPIKLLLADDHELLRLGFQTMLRKMPEIEVVGEAEDGKELLEKTLQLQPDVIITDINMPRMDGIAATRQILTIFPELPIIALTMFDEDSLLIDMLEAGALGYIIKKTGKEEILNAINTVMDGRPYYCHKTSSRLATLIASSMFNPYLKKEKPDFTEREVEIIALLCREFSNKDIGEKLHLSQRTIESHRERILEKMKVRNLAGLVVYAIKNGIYKI